MQTNSSTYYNFIQNDKNCINVIILTHCLARFIQLLEYCSILLFFHGETQFLIGSDVNKRNLGAFDQK